MAKGAAQNAQTNTGLGRSDSQNFNADASGIASSELPFLQNELTNPQGMGQQAFNQTLTQGGQAVAGAEGTAKQAALLNASRTGNTAAIPGIIDAATQSAMKQQSNNVLGTNLENAQLKQQQQQEGSEGLEKMYGTDVSAALSALGLSNIAIQDWTSADNSTQNARLQPLDAALGAGGKVGAAALS